MSASLTTLNSTDSGATSRVVINTNFTNLSTEVDTKIGSSSPSITTPRITTSINDANGNEVIKTPATASAVNEVTVTNAAASGTPSIAATGDDTNIAITVAGKGTGKVLIGQATTLGLQLAADQPILDSSGNEFIKFTKVASAVNEVTVTNAATTNSPLIQATGGDTNIGLQIAGKGSGAVILGSRTSFGANTAYFTETDNGNSSTADTIDWTVSNKQKSTLTGNCTFTFTAPPGPCSLVLKLVQDATGSRTVTWPAAVKWSGGVAPTLTTTASRIDIITFYYDGTNYYGNSALNYTA